MNEIKNYLRRLKYRLKHGAFSVENVVLALAVVLCLTWTYQAIEAMSRNWTLVDRLSEEQKNLQLLAIEVETAELENEYYKSDEYQELMARKLLDKKFEGENMVVLPENSEVAKNKYQKPPETPKEKQEYSNFEKWMMYLFPDY